MRSTQRWISFMVFSYGNSPAALRKYQNWYPDQSQSCGRVFKATDPILTRTWRMHVLAMEDAVAGELLDTVHENQSASTHHSSSATGRISQSAAWRTLLGISCIPFMSNQCKRCSQGDTFPSTGFSMGATQDCGHPSISMSFVVEWRCSIYKKVVFTIYTSS